MRTLVQQNYIPKIKYDGDADVLYIKYGTNKGATAHEVGGNIIVYRDDITNEPKTITILFYKWLEDNQPGWEQNLPINFNRDIKPLLKQNKVFS